MTIRSCRQSHHMNERHVVAQMCLRRSAVACACLIAFALFHAVVALGRSAMPAINLASAQILAQSVYEVTFETVSKGSRSGVRDPRQVVLRSQGEWNALWAQHVSADAKPVPPPLDFARELGVAVFLGEKPTGGYDVAISRAQRSDDAVIVYFRERTPAPGAIVTQSLTQPFHIVRINTDVNAMVTFRRES